MPVCQPTQPGELRLVDVPVFIGEHNWTLPFAGSIGLLLVGVAATFWMKPQHAVEEETGVSAAPALI